MRAAFVPTQAGPLAGDRDSARIVVGAGATLIVEPVAATLALPGAARTVLGLDVTVGAGGRLVFDEGPLIVAAGADVERRCTIELEAGAVAALRETVILGRDGEPPGALDSSLRVTLAGRPLLHDALRLHSADGAHVALAPGHRVVTTISLLGARPRAAARPASSHSKDPARCCARPVPRSRRPTPPLPAAGSRGAGKPSPRPAERTDAGRGAAAIVATAPRPSRSNGRVVCSWTRSAAPCAYRPGGGDRSEVASRPGWGGGSLDRCVRSLRSILRPAPQPPISRR